jgi:hypothetical protein
LSRITDSAPGQIYRPAAAKAFVEALQARGRLGFPLEALVSHTGLSPEAAAAQLRRLRSAVVPLYSRSNFFLIVTPEHRVMGAPPVLWWLDDYFTWKRQPYYLALLSAAAHYGSSHQAMQVTQVMTTDPTPDICMGRLRLSFSIKKSLPATPIVRAGGSWAPFSVSSPEATVFDLVRYAEKIGGITRAAQAIDGMRSHFSAAGFRIALRSPLETSVLQRSGYLLEALDLRAFSRLCEKALSDRRLQAVPLTSNATRSDPLHRLWAVYGHLPSESDW